ncbi:7,8-didemethyl-8-hydroxy-5-deazariboflavin synthase subunit CofG [Merismopedia glauca]|uniref:7,8-didemethyl-8-hydroxy-5-deazariboflavin synthase n=1 Tax=Merismopedia glauca CCAP 1448/3 TaxID=1296344 RepID=A0A2T1C196_9CYAN|nr:7,8-didemethyl-8-hydroxy-5-deazariboflavin synthase subunit CofG [Merismopedia glauca]PSB01974.1 7,8-didemethyl-8-hydroxy-5-deazariboflavin synthase subunit CofG [Merismopedia glauca CCAP 1448/3]
MFQVSYSPALTLVPTYECFNYCTYCNFRVNPGTDTWMSISQAASILESVKSHYVCEILILSGEVHPHSAKRRAWFQRIYDICQLALERGFLPHTNVGPLSYEEMAHLKGVNASMGLMLEQMTPELLKTVHRYAPSKVPQVRLEQLEWAGKLQIPFTTGILMGIGENKADWWETLEAIAQLHITYGNIQEVILQPYSPGNRQTWDAPGFDPHLLPEVVAAARQILPQDITIQIPPNLVADIGGLIACIEAGASDLGGLVPKDEVNPDYPHLELGKLTEVLNFAGWELVPRLPVYPQYDSWLPIPMQQLVKDWRTNIEM